MAAAPADLPSLELQVPSVWDLVRDVRERVELHLAGVSADLRESTVMAASELVENAIKYGRGPTNLSVTVHDGRVELRVSSGVRSLQAARDTVDRVLAINAAVDKQKLYRDRMKSLLDSPHGSAQLGLFRICGEGDFELSCQLESDLLHVTATRER